MSRDFRGRNRNCYHVLVVRWRSRLVLRETLMSKVSNGWTADQREPLAYVDLGRKLTLASGSNGWKAAII